MAEQPKELRSDARDNRARIVAVATDIIEQQGTMASLNEIAKKSGVGPATLYRHFPTREDLLAEVLSAWVDRVRDSANATVVNTKADVIDWLERLASIAGAYRGLASSIAASMDDEASPLRDAHEATLVANAQVFEQARQRGIVAHVVDSKMVALLVTGVVLVAESAELQSDQIREMLSIVLEGLIVWVEEPTHS